MRFQFLFFAMKYWGGQLCCKGGANHKDEFMAVRFNQKAETRCARIF